MTLEQTMERKNKADIHSPNNVELLKRSFSENKNIAVRAVKHRLVRAAPTFGPIPIAT